MNLLGWWFPHFHPYKINFGILIKCIGIPSNILSQVCVNYGPTFY